MDVNVIWPTPFGYVAFILLLTCIRVEVMSKFHTLQIHKQTRITNLILTLQVSKHLVSFPGSPTHVSFENYRVK
jgi:hypothetical protein